jgi:Xaa-Pro aminopeptidase
MRRRVSLLALLVLLASALSYCLDRQPNADYRARRVALSKLSKGGVTVLFAPVEPSGGNAIYGFRQDDNFYYLTGWTEPGAAIVIAPAVDATATAPARAYTEVLYLPAHNTVQEKWTGPKLGADDSKAASVTGFDRVEVLDKMRDDITKLLTGFTRTSILTDTAIAPDTSASTDPMSWLRRANAFPPGTGVSDVKPLLAELRVRKDAGELDLIRHATNASIAAHRLAFKLVRPGANEHQIAAAMQGEFMMRGCERPAYAPIVGSGFNSTVLHYSEDSKQIADGDVVVMDVAGEYSMYASDVTRTVPANGKFTARQREIYDIVLGAQRAAEAAFVANKSVLTGDTADSLYKVAIQYINSHGKDLHGEPLGKYFIHGLGHFVGLNVHDVGRGPLSAGMVFTIEPGIYIPEEKLGVRIEDIYYVDANGKLVDFTAALPHTSDEVEAAMKR